MLSIIIPYCNEHPQVLFTVRSILEEIRGMDAEIIVIDNYCEEVGKQILRKEVCSVCYQETEIYRVRDKGGDSLKTVSKKIPNLHYIKYDEKLSHWNAKNKGVEASKGDVLLFLDAHVIPGRNSIEYAYNRFLRDEIGVRGTLHIPLAYLLANNSIIYKFTGDPGRGFYHYTFSPYTDAYSPRLLEVPVMSTCGMMISRDILQNKLGGWPSELGIYGGGENFINFSLAILGYKKFIAPTRPIFHYAAPRGYFFNYDDFIRNRMIATYIFSDWSTTKKYSDHCQGDPGILKKIFLSVPENQSIQIHRNNIQGQAAMTIDYWLHDIKSRGLWDGKISTKKWVS